MTAKREARLMLKTPRPTCHGGVMLGARCVPPWFSRACCAVLLCVVFTGNAAADELRDQAITLLHEADQIPEINVGVTLSLAKAFTEAGESTTAERLFAKAWEASLKLNEEEVAVTWMLMDIAECQAQLGQEDHAIEAAKRLPSTYRRAIIRGTIAYALAGNGKAAAAFQTVDLIPAEERFLIDTPGTHRDMALKQISIAFSECHDYANAMKALEMIGEGQDLNKAEKQAADQQRTTALYMVFYEQFESGDVDAALQTARSFKLQSRRDSAFCRMLRCGADRVELATTRELLDAIKDPSMKDVAAASFAGRLCRLKQLEEATTLVSTIQAPAEKAAGLLELAIGHASTGDVEKMQACLAESMKLAPLEWKPKEVAMKRIVESFVNTGHYDQGGEFARKLSEPDARSAGYEAIAIARWKQGSKENAQHAIQESQKAANEIPYLYQRSVRLRELAVALAGIGAKEETIVTLKQALTAGREVESGGGTDVLNLIEIATSQATSGDTESVDATLDDAYTTARRYPDEPYRAQMFAQVIEAQAHWGNSTRAIQIAHEEKSPEYRAGLLVAAANGLLARSGGATPVENNCGNR